MDLDRFWDIVDAADTADQLHQRLGALEQDELAAFERLHRARTDAAYDWGLWGAAYVLSGGCSDDSFDYFRAYLISLGRSVYEAALRDPDSLAAVDLDDTGEEWEDWMSPTMTVIFERTGEYGFADDAEPAVDSLADPAGEEWDEDDLPTRYPRLTARYG